MDGGEAYNLPEYAAVDEAWVATKLAVETGCELEGVVTVWGEGIARQ